MQIILLIILIVFGVAAYQVAEEEGYFDSGSWSGDYESTAAPRPNYSGSAGSGQPYAGPGRDTNAYRSFDCQRDLGRLKREMDDAYRIYQDRQDQWHYEDYIYYKRQYDAAIAQCRR